MVIGVVVCLIACKELLPQIVISKVFSSVNSIIKKCNGAQCESYHPDCGSPVHQEQMRQYGPFIQTTLGGYGPLVAVKFLIAIASCMALKVVCP